MRHLPDGTPVLLRPLRLEDTPLMADFHASLSARTVYNRWFSPLPLQLRTSEEWLTRQNAHAAHSLCLVAHYVEPVTGTHRIIAMGDLNRDRQSSDVHIGLVVSDAFQHKGLGTLLLEHLGHECLRLGISHVVGDILPENLPMLALCQKLGVSLQYVRRDGLIKATYTF